MLSEAGRVVAIDNDYLWVETINRSACGSCVAQKGCGQSLLAKWAAKSAYMKVFLDGRDPTSFKVDDRISIGIPEDVVVKSSLVMYCLPVLMLLAGGAVGQYALASEAASITGALLGLLAGGAVVKIYSSLVSRNRRLQPVILDLVATGKASGAYTVSD